MAFFVFLKFNLSAMSLATNRTCWSRSSTYRRLNTSSPNLNCPIFTRAITMLLNRLTIVQQLTLTPIIPRPR
ncbi:bro-b [Troides aeacus nucleopolyhedrovirus]|nr:bro-b [Troides aeacus nucleopolyhedrovirus]